VNSTVLALGAAGLVVAAVVGVAVLLVVRHRRAVVARTAINMATARAVMRPPRAPATAAAPVSGTKYVVAANLVSMDAGVLYAPRNKQQQQQQGQGTGVQGPGLARAFETLDV
jgi:hypothetical protein